MIKATAINRGSSPGGPAEPPELRVLTGTPFGEVRYDPAIVIWFGAWVSDLDQRIEPHLNRWLLLPNLTKVGEEYPDGLCWLLSIEEPSRTVLVTDPFRWNPEYAPELDPGAMRELGLTGLEDAACALLVFVGPQVDPLGGHTIDLHRPLVINTQARRGARLIAPGWTGLYGIGGKKQPQMTQIPTDEGGGSGGGG